MSGAMYGRLPNLDPVSSGEAGGDWRHMVTEYRSWVIVIEPDGHLAEPVEAAHFYLLNAMRRLGGKEEQIRPDVDAERDRLGKPSRLTVNGTDYDAVELGVFLVKARAAVVPGVGTVVAVVPWDQERIAVEVK